MYQRLGIILFSAFLLSGLTGCLAPRPNVDLSALEREIDALRRDQRQLAERLDRQATELAKLDQRLPTRETLPPAAASPEKKPKKVTTEREMTTAPKTAPPASLPEKGKEQESAAELYRQAFSHYAAGRFAQGAEGFRNFLRQYPRHEYVGHAQYWLGECFLNQQRYEEAVAAYKQAVENHPQGSKAPDALLKMSVALRQLGHTQHADAAVQALNSRYPDSRAAQSLKRN